MSAVDLAVNRQVQPVFARHSFGRIGHRAGA